MRKTKNDNRTVGGRFEQELAQMLSREGFWAHVLQQNKAGQPADLIAARGAYCTLIDAKVISDDKGFPLTRVEENQRLAMTRFSERTGNACWFAVRLPDGAIHLISSMFVLGMVAAGNSSISEKFIREYTYSYEDWMREANMGFPEENDEDDDF